jgi:hypothetical protein
MENNTVDHLDLSWTHHYKRFIKSQTILDRELMESISITCIYVNTRSEVDHVLRETHNLVFDPSSTGSILPEKTVLQIIQSKKQRLDYRYKLDDMLSYFITIDPINLPKYSTTDLEENKKNTILTSIPSPTDIWIPPSFFIFHPINTIFFIFRQLVRVVPLQSILKSTVGNSDHSKKVTKRVRISSVLPKHTRSTTNKLRILPS